MGITFKNFLSSVLYLGIYLTSHSGLHPREPCLSRSHVAKAAEITGT